MKLKTLSLFSIALSCALAACTPAEITQVQQAATIAFDTATMICLVDNQTLEVPSLEKFCGVVDSPANQAAVNTIINDFKKQVAAQATKGCAQPAK